MFSFWKRQPLDQYHVNITSCVWWAEGKSSVLRQNGGKEYSLMLQIWILASEGWMRKSGNSEILRSYHIWDIASVGRALAYHAQMQTCNLSPQEVRQSSKSPSASLPRASLVYMRVYSQQNKWNLWRGNIFWTFIWDFKTSFMKWVFLKFDPGFRVISLLSHSCASTVDKTLL